VRGFVLGMPSTRTNNFPESGRGPRSRDPYNFWQYGRYSSDSLASCNIITQQKGEETRPMLGIFYYPLLSLLEKGSRSATVQIVMVIAYVLYRTTWFPMTSDDSSSSLGSPIPGVNWALAAYNDNAISRF